MNKVLDGKTWKHVFLTKYDVSQIQHTQVWGWTSDQQVVAVVQEGSWYRLDVFWDGKVGIWKNGTTVSDNQKFTRVMSGELGKYDLC